MVHLLIRVRNRVLPTKLLYLRVELEKHDWAVEEDDDEEVDIDGDLELLHLA